MRFYIEALLKMDKVCENFKKSIIKVCFEQPSSDLITGLSCYSPYYQGLLSPIKGVLEVIEIFGIRILEVNKKSLQSTVAQLEDPEVVKFQDLFEQNIDELIGMFCRKDVKMQIRDRLSILNSEEISRLDEAIHCFLEDCNYSAVAMSVSAIEFRLLSLMTSISSDPRLEKMTLGQLINEYLNNKTKYRSVIPEKHEPLLEHCNTYRVFSVHPKREKINKSVATSILHMTFQLLLDKSLVLESR